MVLILLLLFGRDCFAAGSDSLRVFCSHRVQLLVNDGDLVTQGGLSLDAVGVFIARQAQKKAQGVDFLLNFGDDN